ncbi:MAG: DUF1800 domain-containing protein [Rhodobacteraceae bacterium]|nr:DUF1800 domain-containing protein [Paracoccaceae bacterium]
MLTRRGFHALALASAAGAAARSAAASGAKAETADLWLNRLTFGATPAAREEFRALGAAGWLERQLAAPGRPDPALARRLAAARLRLAYEAEDDGQGNAWPAADELRPLDWLEAPPAAAVELVDYDRPMSYARRIRPAEEVIAASLIRAVHAEAQLNEVMTQFWHDHFNVTATKDESTAAFFAGYDAMLRRHALGSFRALLGGVARAPSMLNYLNNSESRASPANENFARELLELHTLGAGNYLNDRYQDWHEVPGAEAGRAEGYIDQDVYEVARAFTGWTVGDGRWIAEGAAAPRSGEFFYVEAWHDPYQKRILGREFPPNRAPLADGEEVLDLLATHPGTARFVTAKIARRLLGDEPPAALVERMAVAFLEAAGAPDQIARVVRVLALSPEFAATPPSKLRRPFEYLATLLRASGAEVDAPEAAWRWELGRAGWHQHECGPPTGHPDVSGRWANTTVLARLCDLALYAHEPWAGITSTDLAAVLPPGIGTHGALAEFWAERLGQADPAARDLYLAGIGAGPGDPLPADSEERRQAAAIAFAIAAVGPGTLLR